MDDQDRIISGEVFYNALWHDVAKCVRVSALATQNVLLVMRRGMLTPCWSAP